MVVVRVEKQEGVVVIRPVGELTEMDNLRDLGEILEEYLGQNCRDFVIGLAEVTRIDSSGLGSLYGIYKKALEAKAKMVFAAIPERLYRVFEVMNFRSVVPSLGTVEEAVGSLRGT